MSWLVVPPPPGTADSQPSKDFVFRNGFSEAFITRPRNQHKTVTYEGYQRAIFLYGNEAQLLQGLNNSRYRVREWLDGDTAEEYRQRFASEGFGDPRTRSLSTTVFAAVDYAPAPITGAQAAELMAAHPQPLFMRRYMRRRRRNQLGQSRGQNPGNLDIQAMTALDIALGDLSERLYDGSPRIPLTYNIDYNNSRGYCTIQWKHKVGIMTAAHGWLLTTFLRTPQPRLHDSWLAADLPSILRALRMDEFVPVIPTLTQPDGSRLGVFQPPERCSTSTLSIAELETSAGKSPLQTFALACAAARHSAGKSLDDALSADAAEIEAAAADLSFQDLEDISQGRMFAWGFPVEENAGSGGPDDSEDSEDSEDSDGSGGSGGSGGSEGLGDPEGSDGSRGSRGPDHPDHPDPPNAPGASTES